MREYNASRIRYILREEEKYLLFLARSAQEREEKNLLINIPNLSLESEWVSIPFHCDLGKGKIIWEVARNQINTRGGGGKILTTDGWETQIQSHSFDSHLSPAVIWENFNFKPPLEYIQKIGCIRGLFYCQNKDQ